ncbi:MAG: hypothetical protein K5753_02975 [Clostridia bacterium]|nr:hypothetical protein [Clostridia bacterium]
MKRILLIIAVVILVGIAASALALEYNSAEPKTGTLTADSMFELTLNSTASSSVRLTPGVPSVYPLVCGFDGSPSAPQSGTGNLTITLADTIVCSMDLITVTVYSDAACASPIAGKTQTGAGTISINGITSETTYYIAISVESGYADSTGIGGTIQFAFTDAQ